MLWSGMVNTGTANVRFRAMMDRWKRFYMSHATSHEKNKIIDQLLSSWRRQKPRGRFVKKCTSGDNNNNINTPWCEVTDGETIHKVLQRYLSRKKGDTPHLTEEQVVALQRELHSEAVAVDDDGQGFRHEHNPRTASFQAPTSRSCQAAALVGGALCRSPSCCQDNESDRKPVRAPHDQAFRSHSLSTVPCSSCGTRTNYLQAARPTLGPKDDGDQPMKAPLSGCHELLLEEGPGALKAARVDGPGALKAARVDGDDDDDDGSGPRPSKRRRPCCETERNDARTNRFRRDGEATEERVIGTEDPAAPLAGMVGKAGDAADLDAADLDSFDLDLDLDLFLNFDGDADHRIPDDEDIDALAAAGPASHSVTEMQAAAHGDDEAAAADDDRLLFLHLEDDADADDQIPDDDDATEAWAAAGAASESVTETELAAHGADDDQEGVDPSPAAPDDDDDDADGFASSAPHPEGLVDVRPLEPPQRHAAAAAAAVAAATGGRDGACMSAGQGAAVPCLLLPSVPAPDDDDDAAAAASDDDDAAAAARTQSNDDLSAMSFFFRLDVTDLRQVFDPHAANVRLRELD
jgi:hypothetical protein